MAMSDSPVGKLLRQLRPLLEQRDMAVMASQRYPEYPDIVNRARTEVNAAELAIEDVVSVWVYRGLVNQLSQTEAHKDKGHFDHQGVEFVIDELKKRYRPDLEGPYGKS